MTAFSSMRRAATVVSFAGLGLAAAACGGGGGGGPGDSADLRSVRGSPVLAAQGSEAGEFAADLLRRTHFTSIVVEVDFPEGQPPSSEAIAHLRERLERHCDKPDGVSLLMDDAIPIAAFPSVVTAGDLEDVEDEWRDVYSDEDARSAALYVLCVPGRSEEDSAEGELLGVAYRGSSLALFLDNADQGADPWVTTAEVQATTLVHEAAHLLGLVNHGTPMAEPHEDLDHPGHDADPASVLYWLVVVPRLSPNLGDPGFAPLGAACEADLRAFGGR